MYYLVSRLLALSILRCICKNYRVSFRLCLSRYCFCLKRSIVLLSPCTFSPEPPMTLHRAINIHLVFAHYLYRVSCPASIRRTFAPNILLLFPYHEVLYNAKRENFETFIRTIHGASLFSAQAIHRTLLGRVYVITMTAIHCLCLSHIHSHSTHN